MHRNGYIKTNFFKIIQGIFNRDYILNLINKHFRLRMLDNDDGSNANVVVICVSKAPKKSGKPKSVTEFNKKNIQMKGYWYYLQ
jgi:hypothetical protein